MSIADKDNFYMGTEATFVKIRKPRRKPDYTSKSGSMYWYSSEGVIRCSNHWNCEIASCKWMLDINKKNPKISDYFTGFCNWDSFIIRDWLIVTVYVKNHEVFSIFNYEGYDSYGNGYFNIKLKELGFENMSSKVVNFYGRHCEFSTRSMFIDFDF